MNLTGIHDDTAVFVFETNTCHIHILDKSMHHVPLGIPGEIYISGITKPGLWKTPAKLLDNPFGEGKIFNSGKIGKWTFDGKLEIISETKLPIKTDTSYLDNIDIENYDYSRVNSVLTRNSFNNLKTISETKVRKYITYWRNWIYRISHSL